MGRKAQSIKNITSGFISQILIAFLSLFTTRVIKQSLGFEYLGLNGVFTNIVTFLCLSELGLSSAVTFALYKPLAEKNEELICSLLRFFRNTYRITSAIIFFIGISMIPILKLFIKTTLPSSYVITVYLLFIINSSVSYLLNYKTILIRADQKNYILTIISVISTYITKITQLIVFYLTNSYISYLVIEIISTIIRNLIFSYKADKIYPFILNKNVKKLDADNFKLLIEKIKALFFHKIGGFALNGTDNILISYFLTVTVVGKYASYMSIVKLVLTLASEIFNNITPSIGNYITTEDKEKQYNLFNKILFMNGLLCIFVSVCLCILLPNFIELWLGLDATLSILVTRLLAVYTFLSISRYPILIFKDAAGLYEQDKYAPIFEALINLTLSIILGKIIGLPGIIIGTIASFVLVPIWVGSKVVYNTLFDKSVFIYLIKLLINFIVSLIIYIVVFNVCKQININNFILCFFIKFIVTIVITVVLIFLFSLYDIKQLIKRI